MVCAEKETDLRRQAGPAESRVEAQLLDAVHRASAKARRTTATPARSPAVTRTASLIGVLTAVAAGLPCAQPNRAVAGAARAMLLRLSRGHFRVLSGVGSAAGLWQDRDEPLAGRASSY